MVAPNWDFLGFYFFILLSLVKDSLAIRCYECNPGSSFGIGGSGTYSSSSSSSSSSSTSGQQSDCYNADSRQIRDCAWDVNSCFTVVFPGPTTGSSPSPSASSLGAASMASPALAQQSQVVSRGCGRAPHAKPGEVGEDECKIVILNQPPGNPTTSATLSRATVCQCKSDLCNDKRPDQVPGAGLSSAVSAQYTSMSGSNSWISPYGSGSAFPGGPYRDYSMNGSPYGNYAGSPNLIPGYPQNNYNVGVAGRSSPAYGPAPSNFNQGSGFYAPSGFSQYPQYPHYPQYPGNNQYRPNGFVTGSPQNDAVDRKVVFNPATGQYETVAPDQNGQRRPWTTGAGTAADQTEFVVTQEREYKAQFNNNFNGVATVSVSTGLLLLLTFALLF
ncbi:DNA-directed RNA polymerase II subunit RPB1-like isoform X1 [Paramacrobiotus metropolitanus]|uniref:DNA-directed RNA polymerase II subunit RPB1-like isoform X1 n=1 Tax=Paramacrobiotus metropolitanus TaxID=2943436 RepID=UPI0024458993|nr:DNA-directed RNA polymerase II subunit RPB1-like isoform X1 [Paramacrobiotus metropolitanus]